MRSSKPHPQKQPWTWSHPPVVPKAPLSKHPPQWAVELVVAAPAWFEQPWSGHPSRSMQPSQVLKAGSKFGKCVFLCSKVLVLHFRKKPISLHRAILTSKNKPFELEPHSKNPWKILGLEPWKTWKQKTFAHTSLESDTLPRGKSCGQMLPHGGFSVQPSSANTKLKGNLDLKIAGERNTATTFLHNGAPLVIIPMFF